MNLLTARPVDKLQMPATGPLHLRRPRLLDRLRAGLENRATVVLAGPGYGKTALLALFLRESGEDSVWLSLDPSDRDPLVLFRNIVRGIGEHVPELRERSRRLWEDLRLRPQEAERLADEFIGDAEESLGGRIVLVLDGVQNLTGSESSVRALRRLVACLPGAIHLILAGRRFPDLGIEDLREDDGVTRIEGEDLLFTLDETGTLLREVFGLRARADAVGRIHARTRGWVTALQLLRQTARLDPIAADTPEGLFARTESEVFDYFSEEVLASEPVDVREFLLGSCPPRTVDPEICAEVLQGLDARGLLADLARRHMFITPLEGPGAYYAYDPLFHDFLRRKLRASRGADGARALDLRYGRAFASRGDHAQALSHFLAAGSLKETADLLQRSGEALLRAGMPGAVREAALFLSTRGARPPIAAALLGEACRVAGDHTAATGLLQTALAARGETAGEIVGRGRIAALQGLAYSQLELGDLARAEESAARALADAGDGEPDLRARVLNTLALVRCRQDRVGEALVLWEDALALARRAHDDHLVLMISHNLGLPHAAAGDFARATEYFRNLTAPDNRRLGPEEGAAYLNLSRIARVQGDYVRAASLLGDAREIAQKRRLQGLVADILEEEGNLCRERGDLDTAGQFYARARDALTDLGRPDLLDNLAGEEAILASRRGNHGEAETLAAGAVERRRAAADAEGVASALLALGEVRVRARAASRAIRALAEAAAFFSSSGRAYEECMARFWLALARHLDRDRHRAVAQALKALEIASLYDYQASVLRIAALDAGFHDLLASLGGAPGYLLAVPAGVPGDATADPGRAADLTVRLLGPIEIHRDDPGPAPEDPGVHRAIRAFCYLAVARDHRATREQLAEALWGNTRPPADGPGFHSAISLLRRTLNRGHNVPKDFIRCERGAYLLNPAYRYDVDVETFEHLVRSARRKSSSGDAAGALSDYAEAISLYRGPLMEGEHDDWIGAPRAYYEALRVAALVEAMDLRLEAGDAGKEAECFRAIVERNPLDQQVSCRLMRVLGEIGDRAGLDREFARLRQALADQESAAPAPATRRVYERALKEISRTPARSAPVARRPARGTLRRRPDGVRT